MAADPTSPPTLRVRLDVPAEHREQAAWALEALLARVRVTNWEFAEGEGDDVHLALPADAAQWDFAWDREPDAARDPLAFAFWWLARVEELLAPPEADAFDEHGRFRYTASAMHRSGEPYAVPVDDLAIEIVHRLHDAGLDVVDERHGAAPLVATHDIDLPWRWTRAGRRRALRSILDDLRRGHVRRAIRTKLAWLAGLVPGRRDPWDNFDAITTLERAEGAESTSYLLVGCHVSEDGSAELHERGRTWLGDHRGQELGDRIGLHGSYTSSDTPGRLHAELAELGARTGGSHPDHRFHYLRHRPVEAWPLLERTGIRSDSSLGFAEQPGFRAGTAHPFRAWDHEAGTPLELVVIPLALMDASFDERYLDIRSWRERWIVIGDVLDAINGGSSSILIHNDRLCNSNDGGWTRAYRRLIRSVRAGGGTVGTAADAVAHYRALLPRHRR